MPVLCLLSLISRNSPKQLGMVSPELKKLVATLSSYGRRAVVVGGVADRYASELARAGQSNRRRAGTGSASSECATRPPLWPAGMAEGNRETFGPRSLSEKQVKVDKDLRRAAAERFFVFRGIPHFVPGGEIRKSLLEFGLILGQPPRVGLSSHGSPAKGGPKCLARVKIARTSAGPPSLTISDLSRFAFRTCPASLSNIGPVPLRFLASLSPVPLRFPGRSPGKA